VDNFQFKITLFLGGLVVLLVLLVLVVRWWSRFYREQESGPAGASTPPSAGLARRVLKNSFTPIVANGINKVTDLAFAVVMMHYLGKEGNGYYAFAALLVAKYLATITDFGLSTLTTREVARDPAQANRYLGNTVLVRWSFGALCFPIVGLVILFYGAVLQQPLPAPTQAAAWLLTCTLFPAGLAEGVTSLFRARERMEVPAFAALLINVLKVLAGVGVLVAGWGVVGLAASALVVTTVNGLLFAYLQVRFLFRPHLELDPRLWRWMLPESFPLFLNSLLLVVFFRFDYFILQAYGGAGVVGSYDAAYKLPNATTEIPFYIVIALFPLLARFAVENRARLEQTFQSALKMMLILALPAAMAISVLAREIIYLLGGTEFLPHSAIALSILIWFLPLSWTNAITQYTLIAVNRQRTITLAFAIACVFNIGGNLFFIPYYGDYGYVAASLLTVLTEVVLLATFWPIVRRQVGRLPLLQVAWRPLLATAVMGVPMVWLHARGYWTLALVVGLGLYGGMILLLRTFSPAERDILRRLWPWKRAG
jgi:O-antigen/teichoic acid export membrane protein